MSEGVVVAHDAMQINSRAVVGKAKRAHMTSAKQQWWERRIAPWAHLQDRTYSAASSTDT